MKKSKNGAPEGAPVLKRSRTERYLCRLLGEGSYSLRGKTVAISGATGGLGRALCRRLCELGATLIAVDRSRERSLALIEELRGEFPALCASHITLDLEDVDRVLAVAEELREACVDHLILNAGAYSIPRHKCSTGYDNVFQINFLSPYLLAKALLPSVAQRGGRVVVVGSIAHRYSETDEADIDFSTRSRASLVYGNAKRYLMYACDGEPVYRKNIVITHPGITVTNITAHYPKVIYAIIKYPMKLIFMHPRRGCLATLCGLFAEGREGEWIGPRLFDVWGLPRRRRLRCDATERGRVRTEADAAVARLMN